MPGKKDAAQQSAAQSVSGEAGSLVSDADSPPKSGARKLYLVRKGGTRKGRPAMDLRPPKDHPPTEGMLDRSLQAQIGRQLRAIYSELAKEPVPDRFVKLLEALENKEKGR